MSWYQLWITGVNATPQSMQMIDKQLNSFGAVFNAPDGIPVQETDGTFEIRILGGDLGFIKFMLQQSYHLTIVREQENE